MLHRAPSNMLDALLLEALDVPEGEPAPYTFEEPRHITSLPFITLDPEQLRYLRLGVDAQKFIEGIQDVCAEVTQGSKHVGQVIAAFQGGGKRLIAEIDSPAVHLGRKGLKQLFSNAGVGMPEMHAPHTTVAVADSFSDLRVMEAAMNDFIASETLEITFDPLDAYFENYTTLRRPTGHSS